MTWDVTSEITLRAMVLMMLADGKVREAEVDLIRRIYRDLTGEEPPDPLVDEVAADIRETEGSAEDYVERATASWKPSQRRSSRPCGRRRNPATGPSPGSDTSWLTIRPNA